MTTTAAVEGLVYDAMEVLADCTSLFGIAYPIEAVQAGARKVRIRPSRGFVLVAIIQTTGGTYERGTRRSSVDRGARL